LILAQAGPSKKDSRSAVRFLGTYDHTLDDRGRVALPARYRPDFEDGGIITFLPEGCLALHDKATFMEQADEVAQKSAATIEGRRARRAFDSNSLPVELDRQGRILVPPRFRQLAGLNGAVVVVGRHECLEIWNPERWTEELDASVAGSSAERDQG
jgi:MraZ protein